METRPRIILLNGVGSVGKSSVARALQDILPEPFLHLEMDVFLDMLPHKLLGQPEGLLFQATLDQGRPSVAIRSGPAVLRTMLGMRHAALAMAAQGNNLIIDEVMLGGVQLEQYYRALFAPFGIRLVGLFAPLEVLEARERMRGDREIGLARWQYQRVHRGVTYDLEIDTALVPPSEIAVRVRDAFGL